MTPIDARIVQALRAATRVVVLTGAGVYVESGIPSFRDKQTGLWENFDAAELATPYAFERDPALVWGWYEWRRAAVRNAKPNPAHHAIATMANHIPQLALVTQNVDDLHERAGSRDVLHLHGELSRPHCENCRHPYAHLPEIPPQSSDGSRIDPPRCTFCGAKIRIFLNVAIVEHSNQKTRQSPSLRPHFSACISVRSERSSGTGFHPRNESI